VVDAKCRSLTARFIKEKKAKGEEVEVCVFHNVGISCSRGWWRREGGGSGWVLALVESGYVSYMVCDSGYSSTTCLLNYSTRAKRFVRCPFYTKSSRLRHPPPGHNLYENPQNFGCAPENP